MARRTVALVVGAVVVVLALAAPASAHPLNTSAVRLDIQSGSVAAEIDLPLDQLSDAIGKDLTVGAAFEEAMPAVRDYVTDHLYATDSTDQAWTTDVSGGQVETLDGVVNLVLDAELTPSSGAVRPFVLHYDAIVDVVISHRVFVSARYGDAGDYTALAMLSWQTTSVPVQPTSGDNTSTRGFLPAVHLGIEHISSGSDHLLFLVMLLLPAPLAASGRRWVRRRDLGRASRRVVHVVTAFAIGHSVTLALGAFGWVSLPAQLVESGIALSVLVSALHAIKPLVARGEVLIAGTFGLLHGLAFATLLGDLDLTTGSLLTTLLGFNVGIELTQLLVVALVMPSLMLISRTAAYPALRLGAACLGALLATAWFAERAGLVSTNPLHVVGELPVEHPFLLVAALATFAVISTGATAGHRGPREPRLDTSTA